MDEQGTIDWSQIYDDLTNMWYNFIDFVNGALEDFVKAFYETVEECFNPERKHERQKYPKIVKRLGCKPKTKIFKNFKDHRNCKKYWR